jgi:hypothetical protein
LPHLNLFATCKPTHADYSPNSHLVSPSILKYPSVFHKLKKVQATSPTYRITMTISNNHNSAPAVGHGSGSGNGSLNNNHLDISLFSWKKEEQKSTCTNTEAPNSTGDVDVEGALLFGGALALGAAATWAIGKLLGWGEGAKKRTAEREAEVSDPTTMEGVQRYLQ